MASLEAATSAACRSRNPIDQSVAGPERQRTIAKLNYDYVARRQDLFSSQGFRRTTSILNMIKVETSLDF
jgi:hypothetical protein